MSWIVDSLLYTHRIKISLQTINLDANQVDFPNLIKIVADTEIGAVANADGFDIRFTASDGITLLKYERETFAITLGEANGLFWVKSDISTAGTDIYIYYRSIDTADGADPTNVWDANFKGVWHFGGDPLDCTDSTINANHGTNYGATSAAGPIAGMGAGNFDGTQYVDVPTLAAQKSVLTISSWVKPTTVAAGMQAIVSNCDASGSFLDFLLEINRTAQRIKATWDGGIVATSSTDLSAGVWYYMTMVRSGTAGNWTATIYLDGVPDGSGTTTINPNGVNIGTWIGQLQTYAGYFFSGLIALPSISSTARTAAWIKFEFYNVNESDGEWSFGSEEISNVEYTSLSLIFTIPTITATREDRTFIVYNNDTLEVHVKGLHVVSFRDTAFLHLLAGTAISGMAPLKFTPGALLTDSEIGAVEYTDDNLYFTIKTDVARKGIVLNNGSDLVIGRIPYVTTNGRLTDSNNLQFDGNNLNVNGDISGIINHNTLLNYVANQHINHTGIVLTAVVPLSGGGDISANRSFSLGGLTTYGTANYLLGVNANANDLEYKQLVGTVNQINIVSGVGLLTLSLPQNIATANSPIFAGITLTGLTSGRVPYITTGGLLTDSANFTYSLNTLASPIFLATSTAAGGYGFRYSATLYDSSFYPFGAIWYPTITGTITVSNYSFYLNAYPVARSGASNAGGLAGCFINIFRNLKNSPENDCGLIGSNSAFGTQIGHYNLDKSEFPSTTNIYGYICTPYIRTGTIYNFYGAFLGNASVLSAPSVWSSGHSYPIDTYTRPTVANGHYYISKVSGISAETEPVWLTLNGDTQTDGTVTWKCLPIPAISSYYGIYQQDANAKNYFGGNVGINEASPDYKLDVNGTFGFTPGASVTPVDNGDVVIEATNDTQLTFKLKGSDGTVRSGILTIS